MLLLRRIEFGLNPRYAQSTTARDEIGMTTIEPLGLVKDVWRFPVKSMQGERLAGAHVTGQGVVGDRAYALVDAETGEVITARLFPGLLDCQAVFLEPPRAGGEPPPVRITLPGGATASSDSSSLAALLSAHFQRDLTLVRTVPQSYAKKQSAFFTRVGLDLAAPAESFVDLSPVSIISTATLTELGRLSPQSSFDLRRFRMNIIVDADGAGFVDNAWVGRQLTIGGETQVSIDMPDPRCVMTTLPQAQLPKDPGILRTLVQQNSLPVGTGGPLPCAGVYASVDKPGRIRGGDRVLLA